MITAACGEFVKISSDRPPPGGPSGTAGSRELRIPYRIVLSSTLSRSKNTSSTISVNIQSAPAASARATRMRYASKRNFMRYIPRTAGLINLCPSTIDFLLEGERTRPRFAEHAPRHIVARLGRAKSQHQFRTIFAATARRCPDYRRDPIGKDAIQRFVISSIVGPAADPFDHFANDLRGFGVGIQIAYGSSIGLPQISIFLRHIGNVLLDMIPQSSLKRGLTGWQRRTQDGDLRPIFGPPDIGTFRFLLGSPTLDHPKLEFSLRAPVAGWVRYQAYAGKSGYLADSAVGSSLVVISKQNAS
jgi:hypothetical protein